MKIAKIVAVFALALAAGVAATASAAGWDFGTVTLRQGSAGVYVSTLQSALNSVTGSTLSTDGKFGPMTTAAVKAFQASKGLAADGLVGNATKAALNASTGTSTTLPAGCVPGAAFSSTTGVPCSSTGGSSNNGGSLSGGAGDLTVNQTSSGVESDVKEDGEENVLGLKVEAEDSDIKISNIRVEFEKSSNNTASSRFDKYVEEVKVYLEDEEVASVDVDDFNKSGNVYSRSISLDNAIVEDGDTVNLYVAVVTQGTVDDVATDFDVEVTDLRFQDATGAIMSASLPNPTIETFGFDNSTADDKLSVKSNSDNPAASTLKVDDSNDSDEYLVFAARMEADDDGSDITLNEVTVKVKMDDPDQATTSSTVDDIIKTLMISIDGEEFDLDLDTNEDADGVNYALYIADIDGDITIDAGDTVDVEVYAVFNETNNQGVYANGTTLDIQLAASDIDADGADELLGNSLSGTQNSKTHTLNESTADVKSFSFEKASAANSNSGTIAFYFTVEADDDDFDVLTSSIMDTVTGSGFAAPGSGEVTNDNGAFTRVSGDQVTNITGGFRVAAGDSVRFRVLYTVTSGSGSYEVTMDSVAGVEVDMTSGVLVL